MTTETTCRRCDEEIDDLPGSESICDACARVDGLPRRDRSASRESIIIDAGWDAYATDAGHYDSDSD